MKQEYETNLYRWSKESAAWYENASIYTGYHALILEKIRHLFLETDEILELACGTGTFARLLSPLVSKVTCNDIDSFAIAHFHTEQKHSGLKNLEIIEGDWRNLQGTYDVVLFSYFGAILSDWNLLHKMAKRTILAVLPSDQHIQRRRENPAVKNRIAGYQKGYITKNHPDTYEEVSRFLNSKQVKHSILPLQVDFGQPFSSLKEAQDYLNYYYHIPPERLESFIASKIEKRMDCWYLPKEKDIGILTIPLDSKRRIL